MGRKKGGEKERRDGAEREMGRRRCCSGETAAKRATSSRTKERQR